MEIVATFCPPPSGDPREAVAHPPAGATLVEVRADVLPAGYPVPSLVASCPLPVVVTLRSRAEGGKGPDDVESRAAFFRQVASSGAAFFDLEAARDRELVGQVVPKERVILSQHWDHTPPDLEEQAAQLLAAGTRFAKIVPKASSLADVVAVLRLAQALARGSNGHKRGIVFAQGEVGTATRLLAPFMAAPVAYAAWDERCKVAPGQLSVGEFKALVGHLGDRPKRVYGVIGAEAHRSLSPRMHAAGFRAVGLPYAFVPFTVRAEEELVQLIKPAGEGPFDPLGLPVFGFAVTMPWKEKAALLCDLLAPRAERARAVNTVLPRPGKVVGDLTDVDGITRVLLEAGVSLGGARVAVLGTGGAARAALVALQLAGSQAVVVARDGAKAEALARTFAARVAAPEELFGVEAFVNATPAGTDGREDAFLHRLALPSGCVVVDMPYGNGPTYLQLLAEERGWDYVSGREVLLYQGVSQFAAMNGVAPPVGAMAAALGLEEGKS
ncbi:MAG: type I 3-dehydroquinate dehydratase [Thermoanaerobaculum sp.]